MKPLVAQLDRVKNLPAPEFGSLQTWERANIGAFAIGDPAAADSSRNSQGQYGTPMPFIGETKVRLSTFILLRVLLDLLGCIFDIIKLDFNVGPLLSCTGKQ